MGKWVSIKLSKNRVWFLFSKKWCGGRVGWQKREQETLRNTYRSLKSTYRSLKSNLLALELVGKWAGGFHTNDQNYIWLPFLLTGTVGKWAQ